MRTIGPAQLIKQLVQDVLQSYKLTIYLVQLCYMVAELSSQHHLIVEFVPSCQGGEFGAWELCDRREVQAMDGHADEVHSV